MAGLERLGEGLERVWKGFGKGDGGAWTGWHEVLDMVLALSRNEWVQDAKYGARRPHMEEINATFQL